MSKNFNIQELKNPTWVLRRLINCESITPNDGGSLDLLQDWLDFLGFRVERLSFGEGKTRVDNLYARYGTGGGGLLFLGHVDVVPPGDLSGWDYDPFGADICQWPGEGEVMIGRGAVDMKGGVAAYLSSLARIKDKEELKNFTIPLSFFVTSDEEGEAVNGAAKAFSRLSSMGETWDFCLNGEPTSREKLGDLIKLGRRGSLNGEIKAWGTQGHTGYVHLFDNALHRLLRLLKPLSEVSLDKGSEFFECSTLSITNVEVNNTAKNVIPGFAKGNFNVRYNDLYTAESLQDFIENLLVSVGEPEGSYELSTNNTAKSFVTQPGPEVDCLINSCREVLGIAPRLGTNGGTSDSRFIKDYCDVLDFGLCGTTMHCVNERVLLTDLEKVTCVYEHFIKSYASSRGALSKTT